MPAIYAHDKFGSMVYRKLTGEIGEIVRKYPREFRIGLQGPDILFFYNPLKENPVSTLGYRLHEETATRFIEHALPVLRQKGTDSREYAYLLGFTCHFILDSECHPFVEEQVLLTGVDHNGIESEFEKYVMRTDGIAPLTYRIGDTVPTDKRTAAAAAPFYRGMDTKTVRKALQFMKHSKNFFVCKSNFKRKFILDVMRLLKVYDSFSGLIMRKKNDPRCADSNRGLYTRMMNAVPIAVTMLGELHKTVTENAPIHARFDRHFE